MQKQRVVSWLSQHNFPHGMIFFSEGLVHDPLRQKTIFLRNLIQEVQLLRQTNIVTLTGQLIYLIKHEKQFVLRPAVISRFICHSFANSLLCCSLRLCCIEMPKHISD